jgi:hypothetical protein
MDRNIVLGMVMKSHFVNWQKKAYWNGQSPESPLSYSFDTVEIDTRDEAEDNVHRELAVHRFNNSIAIAWGLKVKELTEPWARKYPDQNDASIHLLDIFYSGELILRTRYAAVDCARAYIPLPKSNQTRVTTQDFKLIKLLNYVESPPAAHGYFDMHFKTSGFLVMDAP